MHFFAVIPKTSQTLFLVLVVVVATLLRLGTLLRLILRTTFLV